MSDTNGLPKNTALELIRTRYEEDFNRWEAETRALADVPGAIEGESLPERARRRRNALAEAGLCAPPSPPPTPDQSFAPDLIPDPGNVRGGPDDLKALIDAAVGIVDVYQRYSGKSLPAIRGTRPEVKVSCPLPSHEDRDPSASLNTQEQVWNCFLCGGGDKYHLAARFYGLDTNNDFPEVLQRMAVDFAIPNAAPRNSANSLPLPAAGATEYDQKKGGPKTKAQMHAERVEYHASELRARREAQRLIDAEELGEGGAEHVRGRLLTIGQLRAMPPPRWRLEGIIPERSTGMVFGPGESLKSFLALGWALSIAEGQAWEADGAYAVEQCNVVYVAGEGATGTPARVAAWEEWNRHEVGDGILWYPEPVNLRDDLWVEQFAEAVASHRPGLIVFDTLAKCAVGADENSARDMGVIHHSLGWLNREIDCASFVIHHSTKDGENYRGSSALFDNVDWAVGVERTDNRIRVFCDKQKDAAHFADIHLETVEMAGSLVLRGAARSSTGLERADDLFELLCQMSAIEAVSGTKLQQAAESDLKIPRRSYYRIVEGLVTKGFAQNIGTDKRALLRATPAGKQLVSAIGAT